MGVSWVKYSFVITVLGKGWNSAQLNRQVMPLDHAKTSSDYIADAMGPAKESSFVFKCN